MACLLQGYQETSVYREHFRECICIPPLSRSAHRFRQQKKLKRKEYHTPTDFANDVELVFSNALEFNQEHTDIWEDALVLRVRSLVHSLL